MKKDEGETGGTEEKSTIKGCWTAFTWLFTIGMYAFWMVAVFSVLFHIFGDDPEWAYETGVFAFGGALFFTLLHLLFRRGISEALDILLQWPP